jgi:hypothetical protein
MTSVCFVGMLSVRDGWDKYVLVGCCLFVLCGCVGILWEEYILQSNHKKSDGQNQPQRDT